MRWMTTTMMALLIAAPVTAQQGRRGGPGPGAERGHGPDGQRRGRMEQRVEHRADRLADALDLSADQRAAFDELRTAQKSANQPKHEQMKQLHQEMKALQDAGSTDAEALGSKMIAIRQLRDELKASRQQFEADFAKLLTSEQQFALEALKQARPERGAGGRAGRWGQHRRGGVHPPPAD